MCRLIFPKLFSKVVKADLSVAPKVLNPKKDDGESTTGVQRI